MTGTVNQYDDIKGVGYITPDDGDEDIYLHCSQIETDSNYEHLKPGQSVEYKPVIDIVFPFASCVHIIED